MKRKNNFNIGHFPVGTVFEFECPTGGYIPEEERKYPDETYNRQIATVVSVIENGAHSYILEYPEWQDSGKCLAAVNMGWARRIIKRGTGKLIEQDQILTDSLRQKRVDYMAEHHPGWGVNKETLQNSNGPVNGNKYKIEFLRGFVHMWLTERGYFKHGTQHLYSIDYIVETVWARLPKEESRWGAVSNIGKKKFAKIMKQVLAKAKVSRAKTHREDQAEQMREYERDFDYGDI